MAVVPNVSAQDRSPGPAPQFTESDETAIAQQAGDSTTRAAAASLFPNFWLLPVQGAGMTPNARVNTGAISLSGWLQSDGAWIFQNKEYRSGLMKYSGEDANNYSYTAWDRAGKKWAFSIDKAEDPTFKDHRVFVDAPDDAVGLIFLGYFVKVD